MAMEPTSPNRVFSCFHPANTLPQSPYFIKITEDGTAQISGLCRTCHHNHCEEKHRLVKEYWLGKIEDLRRVLAQATVELWNGYDEVLTTKKNEAEKVMEGWVENLERESREVWAEFEVRWGR